MSGNEKRAYRQSIAPVSPNTGAAGISGPISSNYRRTSASLRHVRDNTSVRNENRRRSPLPDQSRRDDITRDANNRVVVNNQRPAPAVQQLQKETKQLSNPESSPSIESSQAVVSNQQQPSPLDAQIRQTLTKLNNQEPSPRDESLQQEIARLKQTIKERDDDVETLIYEVYRLQELSAKVKDANDARSNDFALLKKEAEMLKQDFAERTTKNEERMKKLMTRLQEREYRIMQLEQQLDQSSKTISDLELQLNRMTSPSIGVTPNRIPQRQYRATKSYEETKSAAVLGGAPISYRSRSQKQNTNGAGVVTNDIGGEPKVGEPKTLDVMSTVPNGDDQQYDDELNSEMIDQGVDATPKAARRYHRPHGIGVGDKGMLEEQGDIGNRE